MRGRRWCLVALLWVGPARAVNLTERYPGDLAEGRTVTVATGREHVWAVSGLRLRLPGLTVELGDYHAVLYQSGNQVLWAMLRPLVPGVLRQGERQEAVTGAWLRCHPSRLGLLLPEARVTGPGPAMAVAHAERSRRWRVASKSPVAGETVVPARDALRLDLDTGGGRRGFVIDLEQGRWRVLDEVSGPSLPVAAKLTAQEAEAAYRRAWAEFDRHYAMFGLKPRVDWTALGDQHLPAARQASDAYELGLVLTALAAPLEDLHVVVRLGDEVVPGYQRDRLLNAHARAVTRALGGLRKASSDVYWARTDDGVGYLCVDALTDERLPAVVDEVLEQLKDTRALLLDLRFNGGGNEPLARQVAGRFVDRERTYAWSRVRTGPAHGDLSEPRGRTLSPRGPWRYERRVVVLQGRRTMSSAEGFLLMLRACPQVVTVGDFSAGASGNPQTVELAGGLTITVPQWLALDADRQPFENVGLRPAVLVTARAGDFSPTSDPVFAAALREARRP